MDLLVQARHCWQGQWPTIPTVPSLEFLVPSLYRSTLEKGLVWFVSFLSWPGTCVPFCHVKWLLYPLLILVEKRA
jgi:hypothetical protein